jgi:hypothetical protein
MTLNAFAARSHIRNVLLCALATLALAACGAEGGSSSAAAVSTTDSNDSVASLVQPNVGMIDRSEGIDDAASAHAGVITATATASASTGSTSTGGASGSVPVVSTTTPASGTTVGSTAKVTTPVQTASTGVATLDWTPPTENTDGSVLTNLAGYTVYYGSSPDDLSKTIKVTNAGLTAYTVTDLPAGTWYFAVTSYSSAGVESSRSGTISAKI